MEIDTFKKSDITQAINTILCVLKDNPINKKQIKLALSMALEDLQHPNDNIQFYGPEGVKDNVKEVNKKVEQLNEIVKENNGKDSNIECMCIDAILELLSKMNIKEIRQTKLFHKDI